ncbi:hypothetical protein RYA05_03900 [Pseudomonas syringae pv. actinidiae]|nr:hypothetical protein [Pseudomonas syringae pv. actinidiae]
MTHAVVLKKISEARQTLSDRYVPADYDVVVDGIKVGVLHGRSPGRGPARFWHELRNLQGQCVPGIVSVRGRDRIKLNALAVELLLAIQSKG